MAALQQSCVDLEAGKGLGAAAGEGGGGGGCGCGSGGNYSIHNVVREGRSSDGNENSSLGEESVPSIVSRTEIVGVVDKRRDSSVSECSVVVDLEADAQETKVHLFNSERDCRICHLSLDALNQESGVPIELGCSCKDDLAAAHKQCAEAWFKIKGNKTCEICGSIARNVAGANEVDLLEQLNEGNEAPNAAAAPAPLSESRNFWQGHRFLNFLLACMVFAFVISWLFHFNIPS